MVGSERLEPRFDGRDSGVPEMVPERFSPPLYLLEDTFYAVPIPVSFVSESEPKSIQGLLECPGVVDEERRVFDVVAVAEFAKVLECDPLVSGGIEFEIEEFVGRGLDCGEQPVALSVDSDHRVVGRDLIR